MRVTDDNMLVLRWLVMIRDDKNEFLSTVVIASHSDYVYVGRRP